MASTLKLGLAAAGIYTCYLAYGIVQEAMYRKQPDGTKFSATGFVLVAQCLANAAMAGVGLLVQRAFLTAPGEKMVGGVWRGVISHPDVLKTAFVYVMAMYASNEALSFVTYPTQSLIKSCKMIPVMLGSVIILRKKYKLVKYACVVLMSVGITWFQFAGPSKKGMDAGFGGEAVGLLLLAVSLALDGITGPMQENLKKLQLSNFEQMLVNNVWAAAYMSVVCLLRGEFGYAIGYLSGHTHLLKDLCLFALTSALGQMFVFWTIRSFSALTLSTITTTRKFFTIVLSVLWFGNTLTVQQWAAVLVVFASLVLDAASQDSHKVHHAHHHHAAAGHNQAHVSKPSHEKEGVHVHTGSSDAGVDSELRQRVPR